MPGSVTWRKRCSDVGAVHGRRLVQLGRDRLHAGQERDAEERKAAPDVHGHDRGHGRARLAQPAHALGQDAEDAHEQVVQHAEAAVEHPQEVQRRDDGRRDPRDQQHARPERAPADARGEDQRHHHAEAELEDHRPEREDEAVDDGALEESVPRQPDVVLEADEDGRHADQLVGHGQVDRVAERIGDERQDADRDGRDEEIAHAVVGPEHAPEPDRPAATDDRLAT